MAVLGGWAVSYEGTPVLSAASLVVPEPGSLVLEGSKRVSRISTGVDPG